MGSIIIIEGEDIIKMTGYKVAARQARWFSERGYKFETSSDNKVWTTDQWLNHQDKYKQSNNDDGFNLGALQNAS